MRTRTLFLTAALGASSLFVSSRALGEPAELVPAPSTLRVEVEGLETVRDLRFVGPIVQTVVATRDLPPGVVTSGGGTPLRPAPPPLAGATVTINDSVAVSGSLPVPPTVLSWLESNAEGPRSTHGVSLIASDLGRDLWKWRFFDCAPSQILYDPGQRSWTLHLSYSRMKYENGGGRPSASSPVAPSDVAGTAPVPTSSARAIVSNGLLRVVLRSGLVIESTSLRSDAASGRVEILARDGKTTAASWSDVERIEPEREIVSGR